MTTDFRLAAPTSTADILLAVDHVRGLMAGLHIGCDAQGYWFLSHEADDGALTLLAYRVPSRDMLVEKANELTASGPFAGLATFTDDEDLLFEQARLAEAAPGAAGMASCTRPEPRVALRSWK